MSYIKQITTLATLLAVGACGVGEEKSEQCVTKKGFGSVYDHGEDATYDRFEDVTTIAVLPSIETVKNNPNAVSPAVFFECEGTGSCKPGSVRLFLTQRRMNIDEDVKAIFLLDGSERIETVTMGGATGVDALDNPSQLGGVFVRLPYSRFVQLACADVVEYRVGSLEGRFNKDQQRGLRYAVVVAADSVSNSQLQKGFPFFDR